MKRISVLFIAVIALLTINSCKQCATCTIYPGKTQKICRDTYESNDSYYKAFHLLESQGYTCH
ncbi:MAG: hypothetical protein JWO06_2023 [Bacteroidota bacterium]|nr:hypothetical protein [Bacteroidota bacterium]